MKRSTSIAPPASSRRGSGFTLQEGLWFGDFDDVAAKEAAAASMAAMAGRVIGARPFPEAAQKLVQLTRVDDADFNKVVRVLEMDPGLSQRVLRLVNSAGYGLRIRCTSIGHAAALLGQIKLRQIATSAVLFDHFGKPSAMTRKKQEHGSLVASLCRYLAIHLGLPQDDLFTIGLLHDLGQLMMLDDGDKEYAALVENHDNEFDTLHLLEREMLGFDHAVLAGQVLASWSIPAPVPEVISLHHQPAVAHQRGRETAAMVQTLRFADHMAHLLEEGERRQGPGRLAESEAASYLDFSEVQISAMWRDLEKVHEATKNRRLNILDIAPRSVSVPRSLAPRERGLSGAPSRRDSMGPESFSSMFSIPPYPSMSADLRAPEDSFRLEPSLPPEAPRALTFQREDDRAPEATGGEFEFPEEPPTKAGEKDPSPEIFPCSICYNPTFGARCPACGAHVCPAHQVADEWCQACEDEFQSHRRNHPFNSLFRLFGSVLLGVAFAASWFFFSITVALTVVGLGLTLGMGIYVSYQAWIKVRFKANSYLRAANRPAPSRPAADSSGSSGVRGKVTSLLGSLRPLRPEDLAEEVIAAERDDEQTEEAAPPPSMAPSESPSRRFADSRAPFSSPPEPLIPSRRIAPVVALLPGMPSTPPEPSIRAKEEPSRAPDSSPASYRRSEDSPFARSITEPPKDSSTPSSAPSSKSDSEDGFGRPSEEPRSEEPSSSPASAPQNASSEPPGNGTWRAPAPPEATPQWLETPASFPRNSTPHFSEAPAAESTTPPSFELTPAEAVAENASAVPAEDESEESKQPESGPGGASAEELRSSQPKAEEEVSEETGLEEPVSPSSPASHNAAPSVDEEPPASIKLEPLAEHLRAELPENDSVNPMTENEISDTEKRSEADAESGVDDELTIAIPIELPSCEPVALGVKISPPTAPKKAEFCTPANDTVSIKSLPRKASK